MEADSVLLNPGVQRTNEHDEPWNVQVLKNISACQKHINMFLKNVPRVQQKQSNDLKSELMSVHHTAVEMLGKPTL
jgi:hypothetical protein